MDGKGISRTTYLSHLDVGVLYGVRVTFHQLLHLPQMSFLDFLEILLKQKQKLSSKRDFLGGCEGGGEIKHLSFSEVVLILKHFT